MSEYTRKPRASRRNKKSRATRTLLVVCMMLVVMVGSIAGTVAWLTATSGEVVNTFTTAGIDITLTETESNWEMQLIPGTEKTKDPVVAVVRPETDVDIYLFVKFVETVGEDVLTYDCVLDNEGSGWTKLEGVDNVWYREVGATDTEISWNLLVDNKVSVANTVTKDQIPSADTTMTFTAYAIQTEGFTDAAAAWAEISK